MFTEIYTIALYRFIAINLHRKEVRNRVRLQEREHHSSLTFHFFLHHCDSKNFLKFE